MTDTTKWKLACLALTAALLATWARGGQNVSSSTSDLKKHQGTKARLGAHSRVAARRSLRIPASVLGVHESQLIARLKRANSPRDIKLLCDKLGMVGTDDSVAVLRKLVDDGRVNVRNAALTAIGRIGTMKATELLLDLIDLGSLRSRGVTIQALAETGSARAKQRLLEIVGKRSDPHWAAAVRGLGDMGGDDVVRVFYDLAESRDYGTVWTLLPAAAAIGSKKANAFILELSKSPDAAIRAEALARLPAATSIETQARLMEVLATAEPASAAAAARALGRSRVRQAVPLLLEMAASAGRAVRGKSMQALGEIGGNAALAGLGHLLLEGSRDLLYDASQAIAAIGGPAATHVLIAAVKKIGGDRSTLISALLQLRGDHVDNALLTIAKSGRPSEQRAVLPRLVRAGKPEAITLAINMAVTGSVYVRGDAMRLLAAADTEDARAALLEIAKSATGRVKVDALELLAKNNPENAKVRQMMVEALFSGKRGEVVAAAAALARSGTPEARDALIGALTSNDTQLANAALNVVSNMSSVPEIRMAMVRVAKTGNAALRATAIEKLIRLNAPEINDVAAAVLRGDDKELARRTAWALVNAGTADSRRVLLGATGVQNPRVRSAAAAALGASADPAVVATLEQLTSDSDRSVRASALASLGRIGSTAALGVLVSATQSGKTSTRTSAIRALANSGGNMAVSTIASLMNDSDPDVARSAIVSSHNGGPDVEANLLSIVTDSAIARRVRASAANQLRRRGLSLDGDTKVAVDTLIGKNVYGGLGYGGRW